MLTVSQALEKILAYPLIDLLKQRGIEYVSLDNALGRFLAEDQVAAVDVPPWDNSAMDGYALSVSDLQRINFLPVSQIIPAGTYPQALESGTAARIFTGAPIPLGADAVEMQENTEKIENKIEFKQEVKIGANIRRCGEDIKRGSVVVSKETVLQPAHIGLLASVGITNIPVRKKIKVGILSTGNELAEPSEPLKQGQIYNSNRYLMTAMLQNLDCEVITSEAVSDNQTNTENRLLNLAEAADVIISTGGVSVGDEDHVKQAVQAIGHLDLWKIAIKPGKPLAFGTIRKKNLTTTPFFGLPGNPVSAFVTFLVFVKPFLLAAVESHEAATTTLTAIADFDWPVVKANSERMPLKRQEYLRAQLQLQSNKVHIYPNQSSGALSSVAWANCLAIAPLGEVINRGDAIQILMY